jgi:pilus assembly protein CpaB
VIAVTLAGAAATAVYLYAGSLQQQAARQVAQAQPIAAVAATVVARTSVVVANSNVAARTPLSPSLFEIREFPSEAVAPNALTSLDALNGKVLDSPVSAGEQIVATRLVDPTTPAAKTFAGQIPSGLRAMSLNFSDIGGAGGLISPGDYVDVLAVFKKDTLGKDESMIMVQDVLVLALGQDTGTDSTPAAQTPAPIAAAVATPSSRIAPKATSTPTSSTERATVAASGTHTVTVAVTPEAAERLALAEDYGRLRYILRPVGERSQQSVVPADLGTLASPLEAASAEIMATEITPSNVKVGDTVTVKVTVKNTSDKPLQTMGPGPGFTYVQGQTYYSQQFASQPGKWRVAVGTAGLDSTELPYRWGLGGDLAPGASTTVTGQIKITSDFKPTNFWAAIVNEPSHVVQTGVGITMVTALPENVAVIAVDAANVRSGPSIASSVVDKLPYGTEVQILGQSADWLKVKLPDQREAWVAAGWIVTSGS